MRNQHRTPKHVVWGETLLAVPLLPPLLSQIGWPHGRKRFAKVGNWTNDHALIERFRVGPMLGLGPRFGEIHSPIPGRIVWVAPYPFAAYPSDSREITNFYFIVEVPKGVMCPYSLHNTFGHFCAAVERQQKYLFGKRWDERSPKPTEKEIYTVLHDLRNSAPVVLSKKESNYQDLIDSLNFRYPHGIGKNGG